MYFSTSPISTACPIDGNEAEFYSSSPSTEATPIARRRSLIASELLGPNTKNKYTILQEKQLGQGTFGQVKLAMVNDNQQHLVAVKILSKRNIRNLDMEDFVEREVTIMKQLSQCKSEASQHIAKCLDIIETKAHFYIFSEFCEKGSLEKLHFAEDINEPVDERVVRSYMRHLICGALKCIHMENRIVHRDIQLSNICIDSKHQVKLIDFGIADFYDSAFESQLEEEYQKPIFAGNRQYMAPEIVFRDQLKQLLQRSESCSNLYDSSEDISQMINSTPIAASPNSPQPFSLSNASNEEMEDEEEADSTQATLYDRYAPEKLDLWAVGVCIFRLVTGFFPFRQHNHGYNQHQDIKQTITNIYSLPDWFDKEPLSADCKDLVKKLLTINVKKRITIEECLKHPWLQ